MDPSICSPTTRKSDTNETIKRVEVEIHQEPTRHIVDVPKLLKWIEEKSAYPAQETRKAKLRELLGTQQDQGMDRASEHRLSVPLTHCFPMTLTPLEPSAMATTTTAT